MQTIESPSCNTFPFNGDADFHPVAERLIAEHQITMVIETGTYRGVTAEWFAKRVSRVITLEYNTATYQDTRSRLNHLSNILFLNADSAKLLPTLVAALKSEKILFYLDAHWRSSWPIHDELAAISQLRGNCVVLVDDFQVPNRPEFDYDTFEGQALGLDHIRSGLEKAMPLGLHLVYVPHVAPHRGRLVALPAGSAQPMDCFTEEELLTQPLPLFNPVFAKAIKDQSLTNLRQSQPIVEYYEHVTADQAKSYLELAVQDYAHQLAKLNWVELRKLDQVGNPVLLEFPELSKCVVLENYRFSALFFRYLYTALELLSLAVQDRISVVEIGGGFGGQAVVLLAMAPQLGITVTHYHWIDNQESNELKAKFFKATGTQTNCSIQGITYGAELTLDLLLYYDIGFSNFTLAEQPACQDLIAEKLFPRCRALRFLWSGKSLSDFQEFPERPQTGPSNKLLLKISEPQIHVHLRGSAERALHAWGYRAGCTRCQAGIAVFNEESRHEADLCPAEYKILWLQKSSQLGNADQFQEVWSADPELSGAIFVPCISTSLPLSKHKIHSKTQNLALMKQEFDLPLDLPKWTEEYRFAVLIGWEESKSLISEALIDCFLTGTVPICYNNSDLIIPFGDPDGILFFESVDELHVLQNNMEQMYQAYQPAIEKNYEIARELLKLDRATTASRVVQVQLSGQLGTQLFQIARGVQYSSEQGATLIFSETEWVQKFGLVCRPLQPAPTYHEFQFQHSALPGFGELITLDGKFQSDRGIEKTKSIFHSVFAPLAPHVDKILNGRDTCALHLRCHKLKQLYAELPLDYYRQAIAQYGQGKRILVFSDDPEWARSLFPEYTVHSNEVSLDLYAMSKCSVIVAANSALSWWAGWLSSAGTTVILPKAWFAEQGPSEWSSIYYSSMPIVAKLDHGFVFRQLSSQRKIIPFYIGDPSFEQQLESWGMPKLRIDGQWDSPQSHIQALEQALQANVDYALVFKDTFRAGANFLTRMKESVDRYAGLNVLCLDGECKPYDELVGIPIKQDTSAYLVSNSALAKVIKLTQEGKSFLNLDRVFTKR